MRAVVPRNLATRTYVKRCMAMQLERKSIMNFTVVGNSGVPTTSGRVDPIGSFAITQGLTDSTRTGNFVKINQIVYRGAVTVPADITSPIVYRQIFFVDKQTNGATPAVTDVITSGSHFAGYNPDNVIGAGGSRFRVLRDFFGVINSDATFGTSPASNPRRKVIFARLKGPFPIHYDATAGAITDIVSGEIFSLCINSDNSTVVFQGVSQSFFTDA